MITKAQRLSPEELAAIRERAEDAKVWSSSYDCSEQMAMIRCNFEHYHMIARASTDIPRLLDALEAAYAEIERLQRKLNAMDDAVYARFGFCEQQNVWADINERLGEEGYE
jgi:hypothetical protein